MNFGKRQRVTGKSVPAHGDQTPPQSAPGDAPHGGGEAASSSTASTGPLSTTRSIVLDDAGVEAR